VTLAAVREKPLKGSPKPRLAPPTPARSRVDLFRETCAELEIEPIPWQLIVARYLYAIGRGDQWLYPEVAEVVGRQNGKTEILVPHIVTRLKMGRRIMHTAQDRALPREVFRRVTDWAYRHRDQLASKPRLANGQEEIAMRNGGRYRIVAPTDSGARGPSNDDLLLDEVREQDDYGFMAAADPTLTASPNPQTFYLSNAGDESSDRPQRPPQAGRR
jgi:phage terminase large subunit-like protein